MAVLHCCRSWIRAQQGQQQIASKSSQQLFWIPYFLLIWGLMPQHQTQIAHGQKNIIQPQNTPQQPPQQVPESRAFKPKVMQGKQHASKHSPQSSKHPNSSWLHLLYWPPPWFITVTCWFIGETQSVWHKLPFEDNYVSVIHNKHAHGNCMSTVTRTFTQV